ncbi:MAG: Shedu anti-phage system protein SduA domain-containing protein [Cetobacterium sp.]
MEKIKENIEVQEETKVVSKEEETIQKTQIIFKDVKTDFKNPANYKKTHYFSTHQDGYLEVTKNLKEILKKELNVESFKNVKDIIGEDWTLEITDYKSTFIDETNKVVRIKQEDMSVQVRNDNKKKSIKRIVEKLYDFKEKKDHITKSDFLKVNDLMVKAVENISKEDIPREKLIELISTLIKSGDLKLKIEDIDKENRKQIDEIVSLGKDILNNNKSALKKLNLDQKHEGNEIVWQKYFEKYGNFLLFGSIDITEKVKKDIEDEIIKTEVKGEVAVDTSLIKENSNSRVDIITLNKYGFIDVVELKKSDAILFKYDRSHKTLYPSVELSKAMSQLTKYLMLLPNAYLKDIYNNALDKETPYQKGAESASGLLIIGSTKTLLSTRDRTKIKSDKNLNDDEIEKALKKYLRELNYSLTHIEVITYTDLLENLENFAKTLKIEKLNY